jgi:cadmium resistance protein CadD (predicted permease)
MTAFLQPVLEATTAFSATNVDDLFLLMLCFSRRDSSFAAWQVVVGQYLGIASLLALSLLAVVGRMAVPEGWIGLLGLFPISLGLSRLADALGEAADDRSPGSGDQRAVAGARWMAGLLGVAALTIANGSDNISVYMAMLANGDPLRLRVFPLVFSVLTALWCLLAWWLTETPLLSEPLRRMQRDLAPLLLVAIGALVLHDSHVMSHPFLVLVALACLGVMVTSFLCQLQRLLVAKHRPGMPRP